MNSAAAVWLDIPVGGILETGGFACGAVERATKTTTNNKNNNITNCFSIERSKAVQNDPDVHPDL